MYRVRKREGKLVSFDVKKIKEAIRKAFEAEETKYNEDVLDFLVLKVTANFEPKVKTSIVARPIFKSAYERYEWHMQNGCICQEDRTWLTNYIKSDEYKEIYGKEQ